MKKILSFILLALTFVALNTSDALAQKIPLNPMISEHILAFQVRDTIKATDTTRFVFYVPTKWNVIGFYTSPSFTDTGAATPAAVINLYKYTAGATGQGAALATITVTASGTTPTIAYDASVGSSPVVLAAGSTYRIAFTMGTSDKFGNGTLYLVYTQ